MKKLLGQLNKLKLFQSLEIQNSIISKMRNEPLHEVRPGAFGLIYWYEKTSYTVKEEDAFKMRQKSMADQINAAIQSAYLGGDASSIQSAMQRGWNDAKKSIYTIENGTEMKNEMFLIEDPNTILRLKEIQSSSNFRGWV